MRVVQAEFAEDVPEIIFTFQFDLGITSHCVGLKKDLVVIHMG